MLKKVFIIFLLFFFSKADASFKEKIINDFKKLNNLTFEFEQRINEKEEKGNCTIQYPKQIYCNYLNKNKILVSNGKSLVIKTKVSFYRYPLNKTPLNLILDKNFLIKRIKNLEEKLSETYINFEIVENDNEINIFFDHKTFNLIGWQTKDIYQNINVTYLSSIQTNQQINKNLL